MHAPARFVHRPPHAEGLRLMLHFISQLRDCFVGFIKIASAPCSRYDCQQVTRSLLGAVNISVFLEITRRRPAFQPGLWEADAGNLPCLRDWACPSHILPSNFPIPQSPNLITILTRYQLTRLPPLKCRSRTTSQGNTRLFFFLFLSVRH